VALGFGATGTLIENVSNCALNGELCSVAYGGGEGGGGDEDVITRPGPFHCAGDIDDDRSVSVDDVLAVIDGWGGAGDGDVDQSGTVDVDDLLLVLNSWGSCPEERRIVAYFIEWGIYGRNYQPADMDLSKLTHINYAFANIGADLRIAMGDPYAAIDRAYPGDAWDQPYRGCYNQINNVLRAEYPHIKTLISVGGWTWSGLFSDAALTSASRATFAESCVDFIRAYNFDGVDVDWEYPVCCGLGGNVYRPEDKANYTLLLQELRSQLDAAAAVDGRTYLLTIAAPAGYDKIENLEPSGIAAVCDWINVMTYDFHGAWDLSSTGHHSALYANPDDPSNPDIAQNYNADAAIQIYLGTGVPAGALVLGVPFYGRAWGGVGSTDNGLFQPAGSVPPGTWDDWSSGDTAINDFTEIQSFLQSGTYTLYRDPASQVPWLYSASQHGGHFISFDDAISMQVKTQYTMDQGLGGMMFWEVTGDRNETLLDVIVEGLGGSIGQP
jgi:chitinase